MRACYCIGPQNGQPLCPCQMRNVVVREGRYKRVIDLGPVQHRPEPEILEQEIARLEKRLKDLRAQPNNKEKNSG